jgi:riboflavin kinase / FMN adenylyltransferase
VGVIDGVEALAAPLPGSVVTIGAFDGVHLGHRALIGRAVERAQALGLPAIGYTFHPHPTKILAPAHAPPTLISVEERARLMSSLGLDQVLVQPFDAALADVDRDRFLEDYLVRPLRPRHVVVGFNFQYGKNRGGDVRHLAEAGQRLGFEVEVVEPILAAGAPISSTRVRSCLAKGELDEARALLGRRHVLTGVVVEGDRRGRTIGFPTANLRADAELLPAFGVYATRVRLDGGDGLDPPLEAVTNIGQRPTFDGVRPTVETFVFDFSGDLYGRRLRVELCAFLRPELKFAGIDALKMQLARDVQEAKGALLGLE